MPARSAPTVQQIAELVQRVELAAARQRMARAGELRVDARELAAIEQLVASGGLTSGELSHRLGLSAAGVSMVVDRLEASGRVERRRHLRDKRKQFLVATEEARAWVRECLRPLLAPAERAAAWLPPTERAIVARFLDQLAVLRELEADGYAQELDRL